MNIINKIIIGTANLNNNYGISEKNYLQTSELKKIINKLRKNKKKLFIDTAKSYGNSEKDLGVINKLTKYKINFVTKIKLINKKLNKKFIIQETLNSLKNLNTQIIYGLLIHNTDILKNKKNLEIVNSSFNFLKKKKYILKKGLSIYNLNELDKYFYKIKPEIVQIPLNVFDQRIIESKWIKIFKKNKVEIHVRSIFLQGLLLKKKFEFKGKLKKFNKYFSNWFSFLKKNKISNLNACLNFIESQKFISKFIFGINNFKQFNEIINYNRKKLNFNELRSKNQNLIDPRKWKN